MNLRRARINWTVCCAVAFIQAGLFANLVGAGNLNTSMATTAVITWPVFVLADYLCAGPASALSLTRYGRGGRIFVVTCVAIIFGGTSGPSGPPSWHRLANPAVADIIFDDFLWSYLRVPVAVALTSWLVLGIFRSAPSGAQ